MKFYAIIELYIMDLTILKNCQKIGENMSGYKDDIAYYQIAKKALMNWNGLTEEQADKLIEESSFEEIESQVGAQKSINHALEAISYWCYENYIDFDEDDFKKAVFEGENIEVFQILKNYISEEEMTWGKIGMDLMYDTLACVHNGWAQDNASLFFTQKKDKGQQYQYLPLELIGWNEVKSDLLFVEPILEKIGINIEEKELKDYYERHVNKFLRDNGIRTADELGEKILEAPDNYMAFYDISKGNNDDFTNEMEDITAAFSDKEFVKNVIIPEVAKKGIGQDDRYKEMFENVKSENKEYFMSKEKAKLVKDNNDIDKEIAELEKELENLRKKKKELKEEEIKIAQTEKLIDKKENQEHSLE